MRQLIYNWVCPFCIGLLLIVTGSTWTNAQAV